MFLQGVLTVICVVLFGYLAKQVYFLNGRRREEARAARMRDAVDWTKPPSRRTSRQKSRISDFLKI